MSDMDIKLERLRNIHSILLLHEQEYKKTFSSFSYKLYNKMFRTKNKSIKPFYNIDEELLKRENIDSDKEKSELKREINRIIDLNIVLCSSCNYYKTIVKSKSNIFFIKTVNALKKIIKSKNKIDNVKRADADIPLAKKESTKGNSEKKMKVGLSIDMPNWAYDNIAIQIKKYLSDKFDFQTVYEKDVHNIADMLYLLKDCDIIYFFWRKKLYEYWEKDCQKYIKSYYISVENHYNKYIKSKKITAGVYDHLLMDKDNICISESIFSNDNSLADAYTVSSKKILDIYSTSESIKLKPSCVITDGVDLDMFKPMNLSRFNSMENRTIIFGWVGNSKWVVEGKSFTDLKGIHTIIKPAIEVLKNQGYNIEIALLDAKDGFISHDEMPNFYSSIDCYLCASLYEGTPNPILESMACGIPVITTDVGIVPDAFGQKQKEFILKKRSVECMVEAMTKILKRKEFFKELSEENLNSIKEWDWSIKTEEFYEFWNELM